MEKVEIGGLGDKEDTWKSRNTYTKAQGTVNSQLYKWVPLV